MLTVACVNVGTGFSDDYVRNLQYGVWRHLSLPHKFVCFADHPIDFVEVRPVANHFQDWWAKLLLFSDRAFTDDEDVLYLDLDTVITGSLDDIGRLDTDFAMLSDFYWPQRLASGMMRFKGNKHCDILYDWLSFGAPRMLDGDQAWIELKRPNAQRLQDLVPKQIVSYKGDVISSGIDQQTRVVCFHGRPRPHEVSGLISKHWKGEAGYDHSLHSLQERPGSWDRDGSGRKRDSVELVGSDWCA